jgi:serine/threonine protein kinase
MEQKFIASKVMQGAYSAYHSPQTAPIFSPPPRTALSAYGACRSKLLSPSANQWDGAIAGTPAFVSPEQAGGQEQVDSRCDIYSLGACAYFFLTGKPPFADRTAIKTLAAHLYETPEPPSRHRSEIPATLDAIVLRCLAKDPAERFTDVVSLDAALEKCMSGAQSESPLRPELKME